jgi:hypothetical protein
LIQNPADLNKLDVYFSYQLTIVHIIKEWERFRQNKSHVIYSIHVRVVFTYTAHRLHLRPSILDGKLNKRTFAMEEVWVKNSTASDEVPEESNPLQS